MARIAVIDDDRSIRTGLSSLLRSAGYDVVLFENAEAFMATDDTMKADCIITDIQMPGMSGLELLAVIAKSAEAPAVLVMTAFPEAVVRQRALQLGALAFLSKPFEADVMLAHVDEALRRVA